jgi:hypothetical protein
MPGLKNMAAEGVARVASILNLEPPINIPDLAEELEIEHMIRPLEQGLRGIWFHTSMDDSAHIVIAHT